MMKNNNWNLTKWLCLLCKWNEKNFWHHGVYHWHKSFKYFSLSFSSTKFFEIVNPFFLLVFIFLCWLIITKILIMTSFFFLTVVVYAHNNFNFQDSTSFFLSDFNYFSSLKKNFESYNHKNLTEPTIISVLIYPSSVPNVQSVRYV